MSMVKKGVILLFSSLLLFILSSFAVRNIDMSGDPLFYYTLNAFFISLAVFAFPSCIFMCKNIFFDKQSDYDFSLNSANPFSIILSALLGAFVFLLGNILTSIFSNIFDTTFSLPIRPTPSFVSILTVCIVPALAEEVFFRGVLLSCFHSLGKIQAVLLTAFLFAFLHTNSFSFPMFFIIGMLLSKLTLSSHSLLVCIAFHISYNLAWLILPAYISLPNIFLFFAAFCVTALCVFIFFSLTKLFKEKPHRKFSIF